MESGRAERSCKKRSRPGRDAGRNPACLVVVDGKKVPQPAVSSRLLLAGRLLGRLASGLLRRGFLGGGFLGGLRGCHLKDSLLSVYESRLFPNAHGNFART